MRSLIILEVEHDEPSSLHWITSTVLEDMPHINTVTPTRLLNVVTKVDVPDCFRLDN